MEIDPLEGKRNVVLALRKEVPVQRNRGDPEFQKLCVTIKSVYSENTFLYPCTCLEIHHVITTIPNRYVVVLIGLLI